MIQGRNLRTALSTSLAAYSCYCLSLCSRKTESKGEEEVVGTQMEVRGKDRQNGEWEERGRSLKEVERSRVQRQGEEGITQSFLRRERGMNIPILPCSLETAASSFGGKALLVFVSSLIICMMYSTALYSVMGERWRSGRMTMRPKGRWGRHSQLYSKQRSKAMLLYPKLVTISQSLKLPSNNCTHLLSS